MKRHAYLLLVVWLAGCSWFGSSGDASRVPRGATAYKCDGGKELYVRYMDGGKAAMVIYPERQFRPMSIRRISEVPAPISSNFASR